MARLPELDDVRELRGGEQRARALVEQLSSWGWSAISGLCQYHVDETMPTVVALAIIADIRAVCRRREVPSPAALEYKARRARHRRCARCGAGFTARQEIHRFCSDRCRQAAQSQRRRDVKRSRPVARRGRCEDCGASFVRRNGGLVRRYCSNTCMQRAASRRWWRAHKKKIPPSTGRPDTRRSA